MALTHAQVIDGTGAAAREDQTLLIQGGRILLLGPSDRTKLPAKARVLNLRGRSVLPGLVMLHEHLFWVYEVVRGIGISHPQHHSFPRMYLAHGVTTLRTAGADFPYMDLKLKRRIDSGELPGPEIHLTSPYFSGDGDPFLGAMDVRSGDDARRVVRYWAAEGFTSFKAYQSVRREVLAAMIDEAHRLKLPVTAHLGETMSCREAAELGIDNIEHGCAETRDDVEPDMNGPKTQALVRALIERHVVLTVTPVDGLRPMPDAVRNLYDPSARERYARVITAIRSRRPASSSEEDPTATPSAHFLRSFAMAGGRLVLGSDSGSMGNVPGRADQEALENLVRCGFTPLEAIRVATLDGATFLGIQDRTGSIQAGKEADLLVVRGNPLQRIEDIENVERVFANGKAYDPKVLLAEVKGELGWH
ncbi:MAG TPA: amidohydrolase family protein [Myxococcaceae bacterium]|nr:amidohydrolase family protein [Myxococcaceae bacterium]